MRTWESGRGSAYENIARPSVFENIRQPVAIESIIKYKKKESHYKQVPPKTYRLIFSVALSL